MPDWKTLLMAGLIAAAVVWAANNLPAVQAVLGPQQAE
jgi:hypothetical protein